MENSTLKIKQLLQLGLLCLSALCFASAAVASDYLQINSDVVVEPDGQQWQEQPNLDAVSSGTLFLQSNGLSLQAPLLSASLQIDVSGIVSAIEIKQSFQNTSAEWVEGRYVFPLPDQAAVNSLVVEIGDRKIVGAVKEKQQAKKQYEAAKQSGQVAALVQQHRPNLFSTRFANIAPGETVSITLGYVQTINYDHDRYRLRIPLTLTPRYSNALNNDAAAITPPQVFKDLQNESPNINHQLSINATLHGDSRFSQVLSPSHALRMLSSDDDKANGIRLSLQELSFLDRDFILEWAVSAADIPVTRVWREKVANEDYLLAMILPPKKQAEIPLRSRELLLVIDTSGSMAGESIEAAKSALINALAGLKPEDRFNIIEFNSSFTTLFDTPLEANATNLAHGKAWAKNLRADGGTEMMPAIEAALGYPNNELLRQVVFITDGAVGFENSVIEAVTRRLRGARLFTVGIGSAPNQWFMRKVAEAGRGSSHFIASIADVQSTMTALLHKLENPALTDINIVFDDISSDFVPNPIPDLYAGEPVIIATRLGANATQLNLSGRWGDELWEVQTDLTTAPMVETGLSTLWARRKITALEDRQRLMEDPEFYKADILQLALTHQLLSRYTSFIAVEENPVRPSNMALNKKNVPNLMPAGSEMQSINFPQGAAGADTRLLASVLFALLAMLLSYRLFNNRNRVV